MIWGYPCFGNTHIMWPRGWGCSNPLKEFQWEKMNVYLIRDPRALQKCRLLLVARQCYWVEKASQSPVQHKDTGYQFGSRQTGSLHYPPEKTNREFTPENVGILTRFLLGPGLFSRCKFLESVIEIIHCLNLLRQIPGITNTKISQMVFFLMVIYHGTK